MIRMKPPGGTESKSPARGARARRVGIAGLGAMAFMCAREGRRMSCRSGSPFLFLSVMWAFTAVHIRSQRRHVCHPRGERRGAAGVLRTARFTCARWDQVMFFSLPRCYHMLQ